MSSASSLQDISHRNENGKSTNWRCRRRVNEDLRVRTSVPHGILHVLDNCIRRSNITMTPLSFPLLLQLTTRVHFLLLYFYHGLHETHSDRSQSKKTAMTLDSNEWMSSSIQLNGKNSYNKSSFDMISSVIDSQCLINLQTSIKQWKSHKRLFTHTSNPIDMMFIVLLRYPPLATET